MARTLIVYANDERNIEFGIGTGTWGMRPQPNDTGRARGGGGLVAPGTLVLMAAGFTGPVRHGREHEPGFQITDWSEDDAGSPWSVELYAAVADSSVYIGTTPHWADEVKEQRVLYPFRFALRGGTYLGTVRTEVDDLGEVLLRELRSAAIIPEPRMITSSDSSDSPFLVRLGVDLGADAMVDLLDAQPATDAIIGGGETRAKRRTQAFGRDSARNSAVERRAVEIATAELVKDEWNVVSREAEKVGYDLLATRTVRGVVVEELHVEVKGSSGRIDEVEAVLVTRNEVDFATSHPSTAVLIVVGGIDVRWVAGVPEASGGEVLHNGPWSQLPHGAEPTKYSYTF